MTITAGAITLERDADVRLGRAIRDLRRGSGRTLVQVAAAAGLSQPFLSQVELGRSRPSMRSLFRIAGALDTTQQALLALAAAPSPAREPVRSAAPGARDGARLLLHASGTDLTEFAAVAEEFAEYFCHDRDELLYVVRGTIEVELREHGRGRLVTLDARDSIGYAGRVEHRFRRVGTGECVVLVVHSGG